MAGYALGFIIVLRILRRRRKILLLAILAFLTLPRRPSYRGALLPNLRQSSLQQRAVTTGSSRSGTGMNSSASSGRSSFCLRSGAITASASGQTAPCSAMQRFLRLLRNRTRACLRARALPRPYRARLQPLRAFLTIYLIMFLLLGTSMQQILERVSLLSSARRYARYAMIPILLASAFVMFIAQRSEFRQSPHIELPWQQQQNANPWVRAFLWSRDNTPQSALSPSTHTTSPHPERTPRLSALSPNAACSSFLKGRRRGRHNTAPCR